MVWRRTDGIAPLRNHTGAGDILADLLAREVATDARFCALPELYLDGGAALQIIDVHAEPSRGDLDDHAVLVRIEAGMESALPCAHVCADLFCGPGHGYLGVEADCTVAHVPEHDRRLEHEVRGEFGGEFRITVCVPAEVQVCRLLPEVSPELDRFAERVGGRRGDLTGVQHKVVEYDREVCDAAHTGKDDLSCPGLVVYRLPGRPGPHGVAPVVTGLLFDHYGIPGAVGEAPVTGGALPRVDQDPVAIAPEDAVGAVIDASFALHALLAVDRDPISQRHAADVAAHGATLPITGSPAAGMVIDSIFGSMTRIAASSLDM